MKNSNATRKESSAYMLKGVDISNVSPTAFSDLASEHADRVEEFVGDPTKWDISNVSQTAFSDLTSEFSDRVEVEGDPTKWDVSDVSNALWL